MWHVPDAFDAHAFIFGKTIVSQSPVIMVIGKRRAE
jgi:hypothetical protein